MTIMSAYSFFSVSFPKMAILRRKCLTVLIASTSLTLLWFYRSWDFLVLDLDNVDKTSETGAFVVPVVNTADSEGLTNSAKEAESFVGNLTSTVHVIIQLPVLNETSELVRVRNREYLDTLQRNLAHPQVLRLHLLQERDITEIKHFLTKRNIQHMEKLVYFELGRRMLYSDAFRYASSKLLNKNIVIIHSDCYLEDGFDQLNPLILRRKVIYALSRHVPEKSDRCPLAGSNKCLGYRGSHDAFVFHLTRRLSDMFLRLVHFYPNILGAENALIYYLKRYAWFRVRNPCKTLRVVHNHCSGYRTKTLSRLDRMLGVLEYAKPSAL